MCYIGYCCQLFAADIQFVERSKLLSGVWDKAPSETDFFVFLTPQKVSCTTILECWWQKCGSIACLHAHNSEEAEAFKRHCFHHRCSYYTFCALSLGSYVKLGMLCQYHQLWVSLLLLFWFYSFLYCFCETFCIISCMIHRSGFVSWSVPNRLLKYTVSGKKRGQLLFYYKSCISWSIFIVFASMETGMNTPWRCVIYLLTSSMAS